MSLCRSSRRLALPFLLGLSLMGCAPAPPPVWAPRQSQSLALSASGTRLVVVNADTDSLSVLDVSGAPRLVRELALSARPQPDREGRFEPRHGPRSVDLSADGRLAYVACQWSGRLLVVDVESGAVLREVVIGAEPVAVLVHPSGRALYVSAYQSQEVVRLPLGEDGLPEATAAQRMRTTDRPWGLALDSSGQSLYVTRFLLQPGYDQLDAETLGLVRAVEFADEPARGNRLLAHGVPRGVYQAAVRPPAESRPSEVWLPHLLLATDTAQPDLDFESTVFPALSVRGGGGERLAVLSTDSSRPGVDGQIGDIVSGPRAAAFTPDGAYLLVVNMSSEDVLVIDAERRVESSLLRPLPGDLPEGIVISPDGSRAFVDERASADIATLALERDGGTLRVRVDGPAVSRLMAGDPMPSELRLGQRLFYSANSAEFPVTKNFWVACASCHLEGRSDAVTWLFKQGPRDTPSNAGGTIGTGFLLRNAGRNRMSQYDETLRVEQGGDLDESRPADRKLLDALGAYVDRAIPLPRSPERDLITGEPSAAAVRGKALFSRYTCDTCHSGPRLTDSGVGNPSLDLAGPVRLYDVGTCAKQPFPDRDTQAYDKSPRPACEFDTPGLLGIFDTPPYFHDGRARTLEAVIDHFVDQLQLTTRPSATERADLAAYLRSL